MYSDELEEEIIVKNGMDLMTMCIEKHPEYDGIYNTGEYEEYIGDDDNNIDQVFYEFRNGILEPLVDELLVNNYKTHALYGSCFWYNLTFGLTLARKLYPDYNWECISSSKHRTVVCFEQKMVFDILYFDENKPGCGAVDALSNAYVDNDNDIQETLCQYLF